MDGDGFAPAEVERYARQITLEEIGPRGQQALADATVTVVGAGGLGSPAVQYLAGAGIGHLRIVDHDVVERSNLHRQTIYTSDDIGEPKATTAARRIRSLNPSITVEALELKVDPTTIEACIDGADVVVDATDAIFARYLLSDLAVIEDFPLVHGAVHRFEGQVTTFPGGEGPCYRCLFPNPPSPETTPDCATTGVLGVVPGVIGLWQATEVLKVVTEFAEPLFGRLALFESKQYDSRTIPIEPDPGCPICGESPVFETLSEAAYDDRGRLSG